MDTRHVIHFTVMASTTRLQPSSPPAIFVIFTGMFRNGKGVGWGLSDMPGKKGDGGDRGVRGETLKLIKFPPQLPRLIWRRSHWDTDIWHLGGLRRGNRWHASLSCRRAAMQLYFSNVTASTIGRHGGPPVLWYAYRHICGCCRG